MGELRFEWDELKNIENARKHGVRFEEARTAFFDVHALLTPDDEHTNGEERFVLVGASAIHRTLVVCHC